MPSSLSLLAVLSAIAFGIAGSGLLVVAVICIIALFWEMYVTGSDADGLG